MQAQWRCHQGKEGPRATLPAADAQLRHCASGSLSKRCRHSRLILLHVPNQCALLRGFPGVLPSFLNLLNLLIWVGFIQSFLGLTRR